MHMIFRKYTGILLDIRHYNYVCTMLYACQKCMHKTISLCVPMSDYMEDGLL